MFLWDILIYLPVTWCFLWKQGRLHPPRVGFVRILRMSNMSQNPFGKPPIFKDIS